MAVDPNRLTTGGHSGLACLAGVMITTFCLNGFFLFTGIPLQAAVSEAVPVRTPRQVVLEAMEARPGDPWPRSEGHVILAAPGSRDTAKAYHEPGGGFSPAVGSFGVSFWVPGADGKLEATSSGLALSDLDQQFYWTNNAALPAIRTRTPFYQAVWSWAGPGLWQLLLANTTNAAPRTSLVIRSVGPAGGPLHTLDWNGGRLLINNRWVLSMNLPPAGFFIGQEGAAGWISATTTNTAWRSTNGWGCARFDLPGPVTRRILIRDTLRAASSPLVFRSTLPGVSLLLPEPEFQVCLNAQVAHLMMGLVGLECRPGDPIALPVHSTRECAKIAVALAQAGQLEVARQISRVLAERDFAGPYGPEADAPGWALWALNEISSRLMEGAYDVSIGPHVLRKVQLIYEMVLAQRPISKPVLGPVFPQLARSPLLSLVADTPQNELIRGKIEQDWDQLYVSAISHRGLLSAAQQLERSGDPTTAELWRVLAGELQQAYVGGFRPPATDRDWTYLDGLWPSWIAAPLLVAYTNNLQSRWVMAHDQKGNPRRRPMDCGFALAESHQWLYAGRPERAWNTLSWLLRNQASPGLFTWWDDIPGGLAFSQWDQARGWVKPQPVTPHYGAAAEMIMLQLDMLAYLDESNLEPVLVIGEGIPPAWMSQRMSARGLSTRLGRVDWIWQNPQMVVTLGGRRPLVRLGSSFGANAQLVVR